MAESSPLQLKFAENDYYTVKTGSIKIDFNMILQKIPYYIISIILAFRHFLLKPMLIMYFPFFNKSFLVT